MEAALLIASLALLVGMLSQLALLPRRQRTSARRVDAPPQSGAKAPGPLAISDRRPAIR
jgi:hypothetical protein